MLTATGSCLPLAVYFGVAVAPPLRPGSVSFSSSSSPSCPSSPGRASDFWLEVRVASGLPSALAAVLRVAADHLQQPSGMSFLSRSEYDRGVNTFSPEGRLFQVEYAIEAIKLGSTAIGIRTKEGVVLVVEKRLTSPLIDPSTIEKIYEIDEHMGCAMSGLTADARTLIDHARVEAQGHWFTYNERMPVESNVHSIADLALDFADNKGKKRVMSRPFGVALLVGGYDPTDGPVLFNTDPSGTFTKYQAASIGSAQEGSTNLLQEQYNKDMTLKEAQCYQICELVLFYVLARCLSSTRFPFPQTVYCSS
ncbi:unnamed protein product [Prorocentrum cordatum]|uniref:Proteasome alpha-type subunits domain-containing protein n=1 Tax=Prorocentrum cordatum TaxID=2364126 RepID=A0ABN9RDV7_9DINO|nr:unnamed protein product [Polarella glacialis]